MRDGNADPRASFRQFIQTMRDGLIEKIESIVPEQLPTAIAIQSIVGSTGTCDDDECPLRDGFVVFACQRKDGERMIGMIAIDEHRADHTPVAFVVSDAIRLIEALQQTVNATAEFADKN